MTRPRLSVTVQITLDEAIRRFNEKAHVKLPPGWEAPAAIERDKAYEPGDRFMVLGKKHRQKPVRPVASGDAYLRFVELRFALYDHKSVELLSEDALRMVSQGVLKRMGQSLKHFIMVHEADYWEEGNQVYAAVLKCRRMQD